MKKFLSFLLVVAITITCIPSNFVIAQAQTDTEEITSMYQSVPVTIDNEQCIETIGAVVYSGTTTSVLHFAIPEGSPAVTGVSVKNAEGQEMTASHSTVINGSLQVVAEGLQANTAYTAEVIFGDKTGLPYSFKTAEQITGIQASWANNILQVNGVNGEKTTYGNRGWRFTQNNSALEYIVVPCAVSENITDVAIIVRNPAETVSTSSNFGFWADVQIVNNDSAPIYNKQVGFLMTDGNYRLMLANSGSSIVNGRSFSGDMTGYTYNAATTTKWWGRYSSASNNVFVDGSHADLSGVDSGAAFSWQNIVLDPGETRVYSFKLAVGDNAEGDIDEWLENVQNLTLTVYDENHRDITNHCTVTWYDETGENVLSVGNVLRQADSALTYSYSIALDNTYGVEYAEPEMQQVSVAGGVYDTSFTLEPLPKTTFSAIVENDLNEAVSGASIRVEQIANKRFPKISQAVSDVNGAFSLNILTENVDIYVSAQDHHEKRIQMTADEFSQWMSEDNPVITLEKIKYPEEFSLLNPEDQQSDLDTHLTLQWSDSKWAEYYNVFLWKDGRQQPSTATFKNIVGNSVSVTLENGTKYHAVVCAVNEYGQYNSNEITFTTITGPNLTVSEVHVPTEVYAGSPLSVAWTVKNIGGLSTDSAQWTDTVYITSSESLDYDNILAKVSCDNLSYLNPGESYSNEITVNIPRGTSGKYYAFVVTNQYSDLNDHTSVDDMVRSSAINVILPPTPDLTMSEVKTAGIFGATPGSYSENTAIISDNDLSVKWAVENTGIEVGEDASWTDVIFLRNQDGSKEYNLGQIRITKDQHQNGNYTATKTVHIPEECFGEWSIVVVSDYYNEVYENLKGNNDGSSTLNITLNPPADLKPDNISIPDNITSGAEFTVSWKDTNIGVKSVSGKSWTDKVYISQESTFDVANATLLGTVNNCTIDKLLSVTCTLPVAYKGEYYIYIVTDVTQRVFEYETYGNNTAAQAVTVVQGKLADLDIDSITVNGDAYIAENLEITYTVKNIGDGKTSTSSWKDKIYLVDANEGETLLKTVTHNAMVASDGSYTETVTVVIPSTVEEGQYSIRIQTNADETVLESYTTNNSESSSVFTVNAKRNVALAVTDMQITADSFTANETVAITCRQSSV